MASNPPSSTSGSTLAADRPKCAVQVGAGTVGVDEHDALAELREVHGEVDRDEALADAPAPAAHGDEAADGLDPEVGRELARSCVAQGACGVMRARRNRPKMRAPSSGARNGLTT